MIPVYEIVLKKNRDTKVLFIRKKIVKIGNLKMLNQKFKTRHRLGIDVCNLQ